MIVGHLLSDLRATPNALAPHYSHANVGSRVLLTGHSHQAWPDRGLAGQTQAWLDATEYLDEKWERAFAKADQVRHGFARLLDDHADQIALGANTHELVVRFLSALPLRRRPRLVTSDGEFHSIRRQLDRLVEEGLVVERVSAQPVGSLAERLAEAVDERTAAVLVSSVLFQSARRVPGLGDLLEACQRRGSELLVDVYHELNVVPVSLSTSRLEGAFVVGGGYKYCQLGEGNCFLRFPAGCELRPALTGWFSEFSMLRELRADGGVPYGAGADRFAGATYDPTSHYRAAEVFAFFEEEGLTPSFLRTVSRHQLERLASRFDALDLPPALIRRERDVPLDHYGGFLTLESARAADLCRALEKRGVRVDVRGHSLRLGPAPYVADSQLDHAIDALRDACPISS